jgi:2-succinyl-5-enolpyruvyl-6-hydroxy-3-cyclohexene-1-carboxylate synthase
VTADADWPDIGDKRVLLVVGQHHPFTEAESSALERFAAAHDVAVYVNHISNYHGLKSVYGNPRLATGHLTPELTPDLLITIGGHLGDYPLDGALKQARAVHWRVHPDGKYGDTYNSLTRIFECSESSFFERMTGRVRGAALSDYHEHWRREIGEVRMPDGFPLSHLLVARRLSGRVPPGSNLHFGILNSLRVWEFFPLDPSIRCYSNVAGFGIDGAMSTFIGQSLASDSLNFLIIGDLSFFYDMNVLGNRHIKNNVRIVLVNNGGGGEFRLSTHTADQFGDDSNRHIAAAGHFGESAEGWVKNNGFTYLAVRDMAELDGALAVLLDSSDKPVVLEVCTAMRDDAAALRSIMLANEHTSRQQVLTQAIKDHLPTSLKTGIKRILGR